MRILFILKERTANWEGYSTKSSGLYNSASFVHKMLQDNGIASRLVEVKDNNCIDREVHMFKPDIVIIEALWVVPEKFEILQKLHPRVKWIIRLHSHTPFLANEGIAMEWLTQCEKHKNVYIASNYQHFVNGVTGYLKKPVIYLPNYYPVNLRSWKKIRTPKGQLHIGCFGAVRPMKNQLTQALAAIKYADAKGLTLSFHMNDSRVENKGENVYKNIMASFHGTRHKLVAHDWLSHHTFTTLVSTMDLGMQVSLSETYNIVTADFIDQNVPILTSEEISFVAKGCRVDSKNLELMKNKIGEAIRFAPFYTKINKTKLLLDSVKARTAWLNFLCEVV